NNVTLTSYIEVLDQKANEYNKYAICLACLEIKEHLYALEKQFTNTKKCCKDHFKKCEFFKQKYGENEAQAIVNNIDSEATMQKRQGKRFRIQQDNNESIILAQSYYISLSSYASSSLSANAQNLHTMAKSLSNRPLDNFALCYFTENNLDRFNYLLLKATISNGWTRYEPQNDIDEELIEDNDNNLVLFSYICNPINDSKFWQNIAIIKQLLLPYCGCLNILQRDKACFYNIIHSFGYFYQFLSKLSNTQFSVLHPKYRLDKFNNNLVYLNWVNLSEYLLYYYIAWTGTTPTTYQNHELQQIKQMHDSTITTTLHKANEGLTQELEVLTNDIDQDTDSEDESQMLSELFAEKLDLPSYINE
ncbi:5347_t:CDS:2, partial [Dentiscutata erythropus]